MIRKIHPVVGVAAAEGWEAEAKTKSALDELLSLLPEDILGELNGGQIDVRDEAFLDGLTDHVARLAISDPARGRKLLSKLIRLKKEISRSVKESDSEESVSSTVNRTSARVGRNDACPCGSGRKFKQCCLRRAAQNN